MPIILDGKKISQEIRDDLKIKTEILLKEKGIKPGLALLLVGTDAASEMYVKSKDKACKEVGFYSIIQRMPTETSEQEVLSIINEWNNNSDIHGILVQLPLPKHINEDKVIKAISPDKDADGFHPSSLGKLVIGLDGFIPCTPAGIMELIKRSGIETKGKHAVVVGRSNIVGKPVANLLYQKKEFANCVVTICHTAAPDLSYYTKQADILIAAVGVPEVIKADMVKEGVVIIDVGINRVVDESHPKGYRVVGDVDYNGCFEKSAAITPVPGGVGPMTIAMLLTNTYLAVKRM